MASSDSLLFFGGRPGAELYVRSWLDQRYFPEHPGMRSSPTKLLVIDSVSQHDLEPDGQLAGDGDSGHCPAFAEGGRR